MLTSAEQEQIITRLAALDVSSTRTYKIISLCLSGLFVGFYVGLPVFANVADEATAYAMCLLSACLSLQMSRDVGIEIEPRSLRGVVGVVNTTLCVGLVIYRSLKTVPETSGLMVVPVLISCAMAIVAMRESRPIDVKGLDRLRYDYKGA